MMGCFETMVKIGGYIMLFSILALYLTVFPFAMPPLLRPALLGAVEITTGIQAIAHSVPGMSGAMLIIGSAAFGGLSGIFQTKSVLKKCRTLHPALYAMEADPQRIIHYPVLCTGHALIREDGRMPVLHLFLVRFLLHLLLFLTDNSP